MKKYILLLLLFFPVSYLMAQNADLVTDIMKTEVLTCRQAAYLCGAQMNSVTDDMGYDDVAKSLQGQVRSKVSLSSDSPIQLRYFAQLCCQAWDINNSVMYNVTKDPRYALKLLKGLGIVPTGFTATRLLSGKEALSIVTRCIDYCEEERAMEETW